MTRIAFVSEHASPLALLGGADAGGQNVYIDQVARRLGRLGYAVDVFTRRDAADAAATVDLAPGVRVVHVPAGPPVPLPKDDLWPLMPAFRDAMLAFARDRDLCYRLVHGHFWMSGWVAAELRRAWAVPAVQLFHALGATKRREQGAADPSPPDRLAVERATIAAVDRVIAQCPSERAELVGDYGADPHRIALIPAGVDPDCFHPVATAEARRRLGLGAWLGPDPAAPLLVYVGRMMPRKDVRNVVRALAVLRRTGRSAPHFLVVGGETAEPDPAATPEIGAVQRLATDLGVGDLVRCLGARKREELRWYYGAGNLAVTTPWYEPFGLTPLEAMACARPVVGAAVGGIAHTVVDGETGCLVPPRDPAALADRLAWLLAHPAARARMGAAARRRVEEHFTWQVTAARTAALYDTLLTDPARPLRASPGRATEADVATALREGTRPIPDDIDPPRRFDP